MEKLKHYWGRRDDAKQYLKWVLGYTKPYIPQLSLLMMFDLLSTLMSVGMAIIGKRLIDSATTGELNELWSIMIMYGLVIIGSQILNMVSGLCRLLSMRSLDLEFVRKYTEESLILTGLIFPSIIQVTL